MIEPVAIVRIDDFQSEVEDKVAVVCIIDGVEAAEAEVNRLHNLPNKPPETSYLYRRTRFRGSGPRGEG